MKQTTGHCDKCNKLVLIKDTILKETNTGKKYYIGKCSMCGIAVYTLPLDTQDKETPNNI